VTALVTSSALPSTHFLAADKVWFVYSMMCFFKYIPSSKKLKDTAIRVDLCSMQFSSFN